MHICSGTELSSSKFQLLFMSSKNKMLCFTLTNGSVCTFQGWYILSKTLAEEAAWKFAEANGIDMVTINPAYVIGPLLQPTLNLSVEMVLNLKNGTLQK